MKKISVLIIVLIAFSTTSCNKKEAYRAVANELKATSIAPMSGSAKIVVKINGKNFSKIPTENKVKFNGLDAIVIGAKASQLEVVVPEGVTTGKITVSVNGQEVEGPVFTFTVNSNLLVKTVAGTGGSFGFVDGFGVNAKFRNPDGLSIDKQGNIIITDRTNHSIRKMTPNGQVSTIAGNGIQGFANGIPGQFSFPWQTTIDAAGNIYVVEKDGSRIRKIALDGTTSTVAGSGTQGFAEGTPGRFNNPLDAVIDANGNIYLTDRDNKRIRKVSSEGVVSTIAGDGTNNILTNPLSLDLDANNNLIVSDGVYLKKITLAGEITIIAGSGVKGYNDGLAGNPLSAQLGDIFGLTIDPEGNIIFADASNNRIRKLTPGEDGNYLTGTITTIAGYGPAGRMDGFANEATFNQPYDVAVDSEGSIYVADNINHLIRKIVKN